MELRLQRLLAMVARAQVRKQSGVYDPPDEEAKEACLHAFGRGYLSQIILLDGTPVYILAQAGRTYLSKNPIGAKTKKRRKRK